MRYSLDEHIPAVVPGATLLILEPRNLVKLRTAHVVPTHHPVRTEYSFRTIAGTSIADLLRSSLLTEKTAAVFVNSALGAQGTRKEGVRAHTAEFSTSYQAVVAS